MFKWPQLSQLQSAGWTVWSEACAVCALWRYTKLWPILFGFEMVSFDFLCLEPDTWDKKHSAKKKSRGSIHVILNGVGYILNRSIWEWKNTYVGWKECFWCKVLTAVLGSGSVEVGVWFDSGVRCPHLPASAAPLLNGNEMWYCSSHHGHLMSISHSGGTLHKLVHTTNHTSNKQNQDRNTHTHTQASFLCLAVSLSVLYLFLSLCYSLPISLSLPLYPHWDKSWGNWCPCFVRPPVHSGYKSKNPVRVNPLWGGSGGGSWHPSQKRAPTSGRLAQTVRLGGTGAQSWTGTHLPQILQSLQTESVCCPSITSPPSYPNQEIIVSVNLHEFIYVLKDSYRMKPQWSRRLYDHQHV
jgi:hypothetical protein